MGGGPPRFKPDFTCPTLLRNTLGFYLIFTYRAITFFGRPFQALLVNKNKLHIEVLQPHTPWCMVWAVPVSLATTKGITIVFSSPATKMFQFAGFAPMHLIYFSAPYPNWMGFPIRKSPGQSLLNDSPRLFAVSHVLHRNSKSRHPL